MTTSSSQIHDACAADYDEQVRAYDCHIADILFGLCYEYLQPGSELLDLGIGSGLSARLFARAGARVHGMDFSPAMLDLCRAKGFAVDLKLHDLAVAPYPFPVAAFDFIVCCGVLHFIASLETVFRETRRLLRPGGWFALTTKSPAAEAAGNSEHTIVDGLDIYAHAPAQVADQFIRHDFTRRKIMRSFVGNELFHLWVAQG